MSVGGNSADSSDTIARSSRVESPKSPNNLEVDSLEDQASKAEVVRASTTLELELQRAAANAAEHRGRLLPVPNPNPSLKAQNASEGEGGVGSLEHVSGASSKVSSRPASSESQSRPITVTSSSGSEVG